MKQNTVRRLISLTLLLFLILVFSLTADYFLQLNNFISILRDASVIGIIGVGVTYVIITGGIDLSTGSTLALVGMVMANIYRFTSLPIWLMLIIGILIGIAAGWFNGYIITKFELPEFIATLSTLSIYRALTYVIAIRENGIITSQPMRDVRFTIFGDSVAGIYFVSIAFIILSILGQVILKKTSFGTNLYATGSNSKAAQLAGVNTSKTRLIAFIIVGFCVAIGSIFTTSRLESTTAVLGTGLEFNVIAAVVVGGCALNGGRGDIIGTVIGALFLATLDNGIYKFQINTAYQPIIKGLIIILVVVFDAWYNKRMESQAKNKKWELNEEVKPHVC